MAVQYGGRYYPTAAHAGIAKARDTYTPKQMEIAKTIAYQQLPDHLKGRGSQMRVQQNLAATAEALFGNRQQPAPAPARAPAAPAPSSPSPQQLQITAEAKKYREESEAKLAEAQKLLDDFKIEQNKAAEAKKLQEQMAVRAQGTLASNLAMSQRKPSLQLSPASQTPQTAGTQPFKRRRLQVMTPGSQVTSGLNIGSANLLNV